MNQVARIVIPFRDELEATLERCEQARREAFDRAEAARSDPALRELALRKAFLERTRTVHLTYSLGAGPDAFVLLLGDWTQLLVGLTEVLDHPALDLRKREHYLFGVWALALARLVEPVRLPTLTQCIANHGDDQLVAMLVDEDGPCGEALVHEPIHGDLLSAVDAPEASRARSLVSYLESYPRRMGGTPWSDPETDTQLAGGATWSFEIAALLQGRKRDLYPVMGCPSLPSDLIDLS